MSCVKTWLRSCRSFVEPFNAMSSRERDVEVR